jgi:branched-subunit amino acid transport protein
MASYIELVVGKVALGPVFLGAIRFSPVSIIPSALHIYVLLSTIEAVQCRHTPRRWVNTIKTHYVVFASRYLRTSKNLTLTKQISFQRHEADEQIRSQLDGPY